MGKRKIIKNISVMPYLWITIIISIALFFNGYQLYRENRNYKQRLEQIESKIINEKKREEALRKYEKYIDSDEYIKDVAKNNLGMVEDGDIVFRQGEREGN